MTESIAWTLRAGSLSVLGLLFCALIIQDRGTFKNGLKGALQQPAPMLYFLDQCNEASSSQRTQCCSMESLPVVGGIDVVDLFDRPDEAKTPSLGDKKIAAILPTRQGSFTFYFMNTKNRNKFLDNPWKYAPAFGGFDAFEIGNNAAFSLASSKNILGPAADLSAWTIVDDKLYFFAGPLQKKEFVEQLPDSMSRGFAHWSNMYGGVYDGHFDTNCFVHEDMLHLIQGIPTPYEEPVETDAAAAVDAVEMFGGHVIHRDEEGNVVTVDGLPVASKGMKNWHEKDSKENIYLKYAGEASTWRDAAEPVPPQPKTAFLERHEVITQDGVIQTIDGFPVIDNKYNRAAVLDLASTAP